jgi:hypothetical protein
MTERARRTAHLPLTGLEWRLYVIVLLAGVYLVAWRAIDPPAPPSAHAFAPVPSHATPTGRRVDERPRAVPRREPASRPLRVRTRSS